MLKWLPNYCIASLGINPRSLSTIIGLTLVFIQYRYTLAYATPKKKFGLTKRLLSCNHFYQNKKVVQREKSKGVDKERVGKARHEPGSISDGGYTRDGAVKENGQEGATPEVDGQASKGVVIGGHQLGNPIFLWLGSSVIFLLLFQKCKKRKFQFQEERRERERTCKLEETLIMEAEEGEKWGKAVGLLREMEGRRRILPASIEVCLFVWLFVSESQCGMWISWQITSISHFVPNFIDYLLSHLDPRL